MRIEDELEGKCLNSETLDDLYGRLLQEGISGTRLDSMQIHHEIGIKPRHEM